MSTTEPLEPAPDGVEKLLADLEGKFRKPEPGSIAVGAQRFERILNSVLVPFVGLNAFLIGGLALHGLYPNRRALLFACNLGAALLMACWMYLRRKQSNPLPILFVGALPTFLLAAFLALDVVWVALVLALLVTYAFAALVYTSKIPQAAVPFYVVYLPFLLVGLQTEQGSRIAIEFLCLIPMGVLFLIRKFRMATSAIMIGAVITAAVETARTNGVGLLIALLFPLLALAIWYEIRIPKTDYSSLRATLDEGLVVLLGYLTLFSVGLISDDRLTWTWAIAVTAYEALQCWREKLRYPTRIGVIALTLTIALWVTNRPIPVSVPIAGALLIAALTNLAALRFGSSLLSNLGFVLMIPGAVRLYQLGNGKVSATVVVLGLLTTVGVLLISGRPPLEAALPWWRGFMREKDLEWSKNMGLMAGGTLLKIPLLTFVFNIFRSAFLWLRYFKGEERHFGLTDILYAAGHAYGALIVSRQMQLVAASRGASANMQLTFATAVWVVWGLVVLSVGIRNDAIYERLVGVALMTVPAVLYFPAIKDGEAPLALIAVVIGGAFWVVGILRGIRGKPDDDSEDKGEEGPTIAATSGTEV
jgi:hypothetical protein